jgi:hypothetical protein
MLVAVQLGRLVVAHAVHQQIQRLLVHAQLAIKNNTLIVQIYLCECASPSVGHSPVPTSFVSTDSKSQNGASFKALFSLALSM